MGDASLLWAALRKDWVAICREGFAGAFLPGGTALGLPFPLWAWPEFRGRAFLPACFPACLCLPSAAMAALRAALRASVLVCWAPLRAPVLLSVLLGHLGGLLASAGAGGGEARVEAVLLGQPAGGAPGEAASSSAAAASSSALALRGAWLATEEQQPHGAQEEASIRGSLVLVGDADPKVEEEDAWIGVVPVGEDQAEAPRCVAKEESFTSAVVSKMKRALVLGASALLILALNQNALRELDVSQVLSKPVVLVQTSENVTKLFGALLRGLRATAKITYQAVLLENVGVTLTLWSTCGLSRGGLYGEWQGVICTGENSSRVQKYLQQLWNAILLIALILCTGLILQAQRQSRHGQREQDPEPDLKQHVARRLSALKTRRYHPPGKLPRSWAHEIDCCAVCLDQFHKNQCLRVLPCLHEFHRDCVDPWLLLHQTCPLCKHNILGNCFQES
nr:PREDICTED: RING finger protein 215 [Anolis carolinensis]|eukprot:XP_003226848.3 PREDICTED: RING finger protein 215 [Anolis carolinensis]